MQSKYSQLLVALRNAQQFLDTNAATFGAINRTSTRQSLNTATDAISTLAHQQDRHATEALNGRSTEHKLARALRRKFMVPIARFALAKLPHETTMGNIRVTPPQASTMSLIHRARAMADFVDGHAAVFADLGADLSARLRAAATEVERSISGKAGHRVSRIGATMNLDKEVGNARRAVAALDAMVRAQVDENDTIVVKWRAAVQVVRGGLAGRRINVVPETPELAAEQSVVTAQAA